MGARTTWKIVSDSGAAIWLYSHWGGDNKFNSTQIALALAMPRANDPSYAIRIFISNIIGAGWLEETGFGLMATLEDDSNPFEESYYNAVIDFNNLTVSMGDYVWSFEEFLALDSCPENLENYDWESVS